jgi:hypothetical protein
VVGLRTGTISGEVADCKEQEVMTPGEDQKRINSPKTTDMKVKLLVQWSVEKPTGEAD